MIRKVEKPSQAVLDFDKVESSFTRATSHPLSKESRGWWVSYYDQRLNQISTIYGIEPDDLILEWMKWRSRSKR